MVLWFVSVLTISFVYRVQTEPLCRMDNMKIICDSFEEIDVPNITVIIDNSDIFDLTIVNSFIPLVNKSSFSNYNNLHTLTLNNTKTTSIAEGSFENLNLLRNVYLVDNYLTKFNSNIFPRTGSPLTRLDLSNNLLEDLSGFNISVFNHLSIMNISHNRLTFLPEHILEKLEENNNFYLIVDYNPWNCSHSEWKDKLNSSILTQAFCTDSNYTSQTVNKKLLYLNSTEYNILDNPTKHRNSKCGSGHCFTRCIFWLIGAVWIGIILGNVCKIRKLICCTSDRVEDRSTQYDPEINKEMTSPLQLKGY